MTSPSTKSQRTISISRLFPNMMTIGAMCCGLSAVRMAMLERWEEAVIFIVIAAILDALDGATARLLKAQSNFGAQLDSLADIVSFGVAPALVMHMWLLEDIKRFGWAAALFFIICCALRLARFNAMLQEEEDEIDTEKNGKKKRYFLGVPAPSGALLALFPLVYSLEYEPIFSSPASAFWCIAYIIFVGLLMISRLTTFSLKRIRISHGMALPVMMAGVLLIVLSLIEPWHTLMFVGTLYLCSIPYMTWANNPANKDEKPSA